MATILAMLTHLPKEKDLIMADFKSHGGNVLFLEGKFKNEHQLLLADAIFRIENELEHAAVMSGAVNEKIRNKAKRLNVIRNIILDALGENERKGS